MCIDRYFLNFIKGPVLSALPLYNSRANSIYSKTFHIRIQRPSRYSTSGNSTNGIVQRYIKVANGTPPRFVLFSNCGIIKILQAIIRDDKAVSLAHLLTCLICFYHRTRSISNRRHPCRRLPARNRSRAVASECCC